MIVVSTNGRIGTIGCDKISFYNGQALLWREDYEKEGIFYIFKKLSITEIAEILNHSSTKED